MIEKIRIVMSWVWEMIAPTAITMFTAAGRIIWETVKVSVKEAETLFPAAGSGSLKFEYVYKKAFESISDQGIKIGTALLETIIQLAVMKLQGEMK